MTLDAVNINDSQFIRNSATEDGGAVYVYSTYFHIKDTKFRQNSAKNKGGAVYDSVKVNMIDNSQFIENTARLGGALYSSTGTVAVTNSKFIQNVATEDAGAIYRNGPFYGDNNVFQNNIPNDFEYNYSGNNVFQNNIPNDSEYTGSAEGDDIITPSDSGYSGSGTDYEGIDKITVDDRQIQMTNNKLTLGVLNQIFNKDFRNGHLLVYIDGILVFNATTTNNLTQIIYDLLNLLLGNHEIKVVFTDSNGNTNTYVDNITI